MNKKKVMKVIVYIIVYIIFLYFAVAGVTFQARNPTANETQVFIHFFDVVTFKKLPEFQTNN